MSLRGTMGGGEVGGTSSLGRFGVNARIGVGTHHLGGFEKTRVGCVGLVGALV